jgi:DNA-binding HxlR family transcriptional regulator
VADGRRSLREPDLLDPSPARSPAAPEDADETAPTPDRTAGRRPATERAERAPLKLERLIHERIRLGIVSALAVNASLTFNDLKTSLRTTDGNLSVHARKLEEAGYVSCEKTFKGRIPHTVYRLTPDGREAFERYLGHMEAIIHATREGPDGP